MIEAFQQFLKSFLCSLSAYFLNKLKKKCEFFENSEEKNHLKKSILESFHENVLKNRTKGGFKSEETG